MPSSDNFYLVFLILAIIYAVLGCFAIFRTCKLHQFSSEWRHSKIFYLTIILQVTLRTGGFIMVAAKYHSEADNYGFLMISVPESLFVVTYLLVFWQMISVFYYSHFDHSLETSLIAALSKRAHQSKASQMFVFLMIIWIGTQTCLYVALVVGRITQKSIVNEIGITDVILPTVTLATMLYLQRRYSGSPLKSRYWKKRLHRMNWVTFVWSVCRYVSGVVDIIDVYTSLSLTGNFTDMLTTIVLVIVLITSEVVCLFIVLDYGFIAIFVLSEEEAKESSHFQGLVKSAGISQASDEEDEDRIRERRFTVLTETPRLLMKDITLIEDIKTSKNNLGKLSKGIFKDHQIAFRKISFSRISGYITEEFIAEIESLKNINIPNLLPLYGAIIDLPIVSLVTPWMQSGSLYSVLHEQKTLFPEMEKRRLALEIAVCFESLHSIGRKHGHLTSFNVLLDERKHSFVSDLGLHKMKKYAGITLGYMNKTGWTSPELLSEKFSTPLKVNNSDDVYSYGVVLWELMTEIVPFSGYSRQELYRQVTLESLRPIIPPDVPEDLSHLIQSCWNTDPTRRPDFSQIVKALEAFESIN